MLQVNVLRQNPEWVKERLAVRHFKNAGLVEEIIALDDDRKKLQAEFDNTQSKINSASKEIGKLMAQGKKEEVEQMKQDVAANKAQTTALTEKMNATEKALQEKLIQLPNLPSALVPPGKTPEDNVVVRSGGDDVKLPEGALPHWDLIKNMTSSILKPALKSPAAVSLCLKAKAQNYSAH